MAIDAASYLHTPLEDVENLFPATEPCESCSISAEWTSPLTCQWIENSSTTHAEWQILQLAGRVHRWLETFLDGDSHQISSTKTVLEIRATLRRHIECFEPVAASSMDERDAMYESCRWASLVLLAVEKDGVPIRTAAQYVRIRPRLIRRLRMTDLSSLWGIRKGLLFWIAAVCHYATAGQCYPLMCTTLFAQFTQEMAMSESCSEIAIKPLRRLKTFESLCCRPSLAYEAVAAVA